MKKQTVKITVSGNKQYGRVIMIQKVTSHIVDLKVK
jgi:hypothetical protein